MHKALKMNNIHITLYKFTGAGNSFVVLDGRDGGVEAFRQADTIGTLCREHGTDGLMILNQAPGYDFAMEFYNPDGSGGMMCGNGGRCIVAISSEDVRSAPHWHPMYNP